jgi:transposase-like protein
MELRHNHRRAAKPMCPLRYYPMLRQSKDPVRLRFELVRYAREHGIKAAARQFSTTPKTVRKWLRRWEPGSLRGLEDRSRAPLRPRQGITKTQRRRAVSLKRRLPSWGASRMKRELPPRAVGESPAPHLARGGAAQAQAPEAQDQTVPERGQACVAALRADLR